MKQKMKTFLRFACAVVIAIVPAAVNATEDGTDVTSLLVNGKFDGTGGWTATLNSFDIDTQKHIMEKWWTDWKADQTVTGVENGVYKLEVQGFKFCSWDWAQAAQEWMNSNGDKTFNSSSVIRLNDKETKVQNVFACGKTDLTVGYKDSNLDYYVPNSKDAALKYFALGLYNHEVKAIVTDNKLKVEFDCSSAGFWNCFYNVRLTFVCSDKSDKYQEECDAINHVNNNQVPHSPKLKTGYANPLVDHHYIADPTAVEYNGRLYVYGTNDHQQYENADKNTYEKINTLSIISTDDMVNWTYHGEIPVHEVASYCSCSWAPSIVSREESDGKTHFYLYYSLNGSGTGVLTSTSPVGPWTSPLRKALISGSEEGVKGNAFDPGVVIDDNGVGWIAFGGGQGRIARLKKNMFSIDSEFIDPHPQHHNEANELNYIGGKYVYTYNLDWDDHSDWKLSNEIPTGCCMSYMVSTTPLDGNSWVYGNNYLKNPGDFKGFSYANNHTHLHKFAGKWYVFYHTLMLIDEMGFTGGFRSLQVANIKVDEENVHIYPATIDKKGVEQIKALNPYIIQQAETTAATEGVMFVADQQPGNMIAKPGKAFVRYAMPEKSIIQVRKVDFGTKSLTVSAHVKGNGTLTAHLDTPESEAVATLTIDSNEWTDVEVPCEVSGTHHLVFELEGDIEFDHWHFTSNDPSGIETINAVEPVRETPTFNLAGMPVDENYKGLVIKNGKKIMK